MCPVLCVSKMAHVLFEAPLVFETENFKNGLSCLVFFQFRVKKSDGDDGTAMIMMMIESKPALFYVAH